MNITPKYLVYFKKLNQQRRKEYLSHVRPKFLKLANRKRKLSWEEVSKFRMNGYERNLLLRNLSEEGLTQAIREYLKNATFGRGYGRYTLANSYNDSITDILLPLLLEALEARQAALRRVIYNDNLN